MDSDTRHRFNDMYEQLELSDLRKEVKRLRQELSAERIKVKELEIKLEERGFKNG